MMSRAILRGALIAVGLFSIYTIYELKAKFSSTGPVIQETQGAHPESNLMQWPMTFGFSEKDTNISAPKKTRPRRQDRVKYFLTDWQHRIPNLTQQALIELGQAAAVEVLNESAHDRRTRRKLLRTAADMALEALHPQVRSAMRRHRVTIYQLGSFLAQHDA